MTDDADGLKAVEALMPLDDAMRDRLTRYVGLVRRWQPVKNLVAPSTLPDIWRRHVADSAQAHLAAPDVTGWLDLGSGAGFPGLVTAVLLADRPGAHVTLVEANGRKAAFLMTVIRELKLPATVLNARIESVPERPERIVHPVQAVSARALASLDALLGLAEPWLAAGARAVLHKGLDFESEVNVAVQTWTFDLVEQPSRIDPGGRIAVLSHVRRRAGS
ncbi:16S rRNA (guanine(527)-N(7))-methyltransferase RsmG [Chthonobacter rhizosphaerae]|uniref:16S rRNA (guanine(527)-N(7))-methyltransferase RsmG n=1 Tax=Chthonobacter rhizosphaerae TaxID=2735553 RepID=UPI001AED1F5B|nr:16S rRNA (guanine(527)-N(7))-methyltransferase RsmG [Chthonobacter rhizosphaerae]